MRGFKARGNCRIAHARYQRNSGVVCAQAVASKAQALMLRTGSCSLPHPDKLDTGGEDAFFVSSDSTVMGVADGVGGWRESGIDPGDYSRTLMRTACDFFDSRDSSAAPQDTKEWEETVRAALDTAHKQTRMPGSSTACLLALNAEDKYVSAAHLGDSGFIVVRNGTVVFQTPPLQHFFDCPLQLGAYPDYVDATDYAADAETYTLNVMPGDVIIMGTDGLWDNCDLSELLPLLPDTDDGCDTAAEVMAAAAREHAEDEEYDSPYIRAARQEGMDMTFWEKIKNAGFRNGKFQLGQILGGKLDDITVLVARVSQRPAAPPASEAPSEPPAAAQEVDAKVADSAAQKEEDVQRGGGNARSGSSSSKDDAAMEGAADTAAKDSVGGSQVEAEPAPRSDDSRSERRSAKAETGADAARASSGSRDDGSSRGKKDSGQGQSEGGKARASTEPSKQDKPAAAEKQMMEAATVSGSAKQPSENGLKMRPS